MTTTLVPLSEHVGVEITGARSRDLVDRRVADECLAALQERGVVVYPQVFIEDEDLVAFSRLLGEVVLSSSGEHEIPEIQTITMHPERANPLLLGFRKGNFLWHIDGAHDPAPQKATLLSAREVDGDGGDTEFACTFAAYEALPDLEKAELDGLRVVHHLSVGLRTVHPEASEEERAMWERVPRREHPLVWKQPGGRRSILIGATAERVVGWPEEKSRDLFDRLLAWCTQPRFVLRHHWRLGDLVVWDNVGMLHRALPFEPTSRRLLHRTTLVGSAATA